MLDGVAKKKIDPKKREPYVREFFIKPSQHTIKEVTQFKHYAMNILWSWMRETHDSGFDFDKENGSYSHPEGLEPYQQKVMVFVSPVSGKGLAPQIWKNSERFLRARGFIPIVHNTTRRYYIKDTIREMPLEEFKSIF